MSADLVILWGPDWVKRQSLRSLAAPMLDLGFGPRGECCGALFRIC